MQLRVLKYILDIQNVIEEIESVKGKVANNFNLFKSDIILQRAIERQLEIIGEAIKKLCEGFPKTIAHPKKVKYICIIKLSTFVK